MRPRTQPRSGFARRSIIPGKTGKPEASRLPAESMSLLDSLLRGTPPDRWMPLSILLRKRSLAARLIWRGFTKKWTRELSADETLSSMDSPLGGKVPGFYEKTQKGLSADEDIMYADHSLGGKIANRSLSTGEIFSSGDSFVFYFFYHSERATCEVPPSRRFSAHSLQRPRWISCLVG